jgi:2-methylcitrate dehydratase PrpD
MGSLEQHLAEFVTETESASLPAVCWDTAQVAVFDTVGCALSAINEPIGRILGELLRAAGAKPAAAVFGSPLRTSAPDAAQTNAALAHGLDLDDFDRLGHMSAIVVPAVLAAAERRGASGSDVLAAYILGMEVLANLNAGTRKVKRVGGVHNTAVFGVLAATAAVARLEGLMASQLVTAFGVAASTPSGVPQNFGTFTAAWHAAQAARSAVVAVDLARAGWTASPDGLTGPTGWAQTYLPPGAFDATRAANGIGTVWHTETPRGIRRYPCCLSNTSALDSLLALRAEHGFTADEIDSVFIEGFPPTSNVLRFGVPDNPYSGKFSVRHCATVALLDGAVTQDSFKQAAVDREGYRTLIEKISVGVLSEWDLGSAPGGNPVTVRLTDGSVLTKVSPTALSPKYVHMTTDEIDAKFLTSARRALSPAQADIALKSWRGVRDSPEIRDVIATVVS